MSSPALERALLSEAWTALMGDGGPELVAPALTGEADDLPSRFAVAEVATAAVATALAAAAALQHERSGHRPAIRLDRGTVAAAVRSERFFRGGTRSTGMGFAPLSRFWRARDGWVRTHANYPWHRDALLGVLGIAGDDDGDQGHGDDQGAVAAAISDRSVEALERDVFAAGGIAAGVRTLDEWRRHPQGATVAAEPLVAHRHEPGAGARRRPPGDGAPMAGIRVLDLTRVIAGPVCTRYLGALGADVLRLDPPQRPDLAPGEVADTLLAKRTAILDAATAEGEAALHGLLAAADVLVAGYRPGALDRFGLSEDALVDRHPGLVVVLLDAWGHTGPWSGRRGFDSVVQAPTGIAAGESVGDSVGGWGAGAMGEPGDPGDPGDDAQPGALPCQLLDHGTGYLAAAAVLDGVRRRYRDGGTHIRRLSLARTAAWLSSATPHPPGDPARAARDRHDRDDPRERDEPDDRHDRAQHDGRAEHDEPDDRHHRHHRHDRDDRHGCDSHAERDDCDEPDDRHDRDDRPERDALTNRDWRNGREDRSGREDREDPTNRRRGDPAGQPAGLSDRFQRIDTGSTAVTAVRPPGQLDDHRLEWPVPLARYGADVAAWNQP